MRREAYLLLAGTQARPPRLASLDPWRVARWLLPTLLVTDAIVWAAHSLTPPPSVHSQPECLFSVCSAPQLFVCCFCLTVEQCFPGNVHILYVEAVAVGVDLAPLEAGVLQHVLNALLLLLDQLQVRLGLRLDEAPVLWVLPGGQEWRTSAEVPATARTQSCHSQRFFGQRRIRMSALLQRIVESLEPTK